MAFLAIFPAVVCRIRDKPVVPRSTWNPVSTDPARSVISRFHAKVKCGSLSGINVSRTRIKYPLPHTHTSRTAEDTLNPLSGENQHSAESRGRNTPSQNEGHDRASISFEFRVQGSSAMGFVFVVIHL